LLLNEGENVAGRGTVLELSDKWMGKEIVLGTFFVGVQGIVENQLEIGGCGGRGIGIRHMGRQRWWGSQAMVVRGK
jgi:hypothetical protein